MRECPRCGGDVAADPEHRGVRRCLACWEVTALPAERACPGYRPRLNVALRTLAERRTERR